MSLTDAQTLALYEILEVPYATSVIVPQDANGITALEYQTNNSSQQAKSLIDSHVSSLSSGVEALLVDLLDRWIALGTNTVVVDGGVGGVQGVTSNPDAERDIIRNKVRVVVPFWRAHEKIEIASRQSSNVALIR